MNGYERIKNVLEQKPADRTPVWPFVMSFAAKYAGVPYGEFCLNHKELVKAQVKTATDFDFDVVVIDSDAYREASACGAELEFLEDDLPIMKKFAIQNRSQFKFVVPSVEGSARLYDKIQGVGLAKQTVGKQKAVCGWIEAPLQSAGALYDMSRFLMDIYDEPEFVKELLDYCKELAVQFALKQAKAGADSIGIGDAMASMVSGDIYDEYVLPYTKQLIEEIRSKSDVKLKYHICGNTTHLLPSVRTLNFDIVTIDTAVDITKAREILGNDVCIKGNLDTVSLLLKASEEQVLEKALQTIAAAGENFILSAGCEVPRDTPVANVMALAKASYRKERL